MLGLRRQFLLDPSVTFLNHGSFGATPRPVLREYQRWQRELERQPVEFLGRRFTDLMMEAPQISGELRGDRCQQPGIHDQCDRVAEHRGTLANAWSRGRSTQHRP